MQDAFSGMLGIVALLLVLGFGLVQDALKRRARRRMWEGAGLGERGDIDLEPVELWLPLDAALQGLTGSVLVSESEVDRNGVELTPADVRFLSLVRWDERTYPDLERRLRHPEGPLAPLISALVRADNHHPPGGVGLCHEWREPSGKHLRDVAQRFADAATLALHGDEAVSTLLLEAAEQPERLGAHARLWMARLPDDPRVRDLARLCLDSEHVPTALEAVGLVGDAAQAERLALGGRDFVKDRLRALDLAMERAPGRAEQLVLRAFDLGGELAAGAVPRAARLGTPKLADRMLRAVAEEPWARHAEVAEALARFDDARSAAWLGAAVFGADEELRRAAAHSIRRRRPAKAAPALLSGVQAGSQDPLVVELLGLVGGLDAVEPLLALAQRHRSLRADVETAVALIQDRAGGGERGGLALLGDGGGLALAEQQPEAGALAYAGEQRGRPGGGEQDEETEASRAPEARRAKGGRVAGERGSGG